MVHALRQRPLALAPFRLVSTCWRVLPLAVIALSLWQRRTLRILLQWFYRTLLKRKGWLCGGTALAGLSAFVFKHPWQIGGDNSGPMVFGVGRKEIRQLIGKSAWNFIGEQSERMHAAVQRQVEAKLDHIMDQVGSKAKEEMKDDYMPMFFQSVIDDAVDELMPDIKMTVLNSTDNFLQTRSPILGLSRQFTPQSEMVGNVGSGASRSGDKQPEILANIAGTLSDFSVLTLQQRWAHGLRWCRATVLYNCAPYDHSVWWSLRNPWWLLFTCVGLLPTSVFGPVGPTWWLLLFLFKDKGDEFQLCDFIIGSQAAKFFSQGLFGLAHGAFLYYLCATRLEGTCVESGPRIAYMLDAVAFGLQILLVCLAFALLPYSQKKGGGRRWTVVNVEQRNDVLLRSALTTANGGSPAHRGAGVHKQCECGSNEAELCGGCLAPSKSRAMLLRRRTLKHGVGRGGLGVESRLRGISDDGEGIKSVDTLREPENQHASSDEDSDGEAVPFRIGSGFDQIWGGLWHHQQHIRKYYTNASRGGHLMRLFWFDTVVVSLVFWVGAVVLLFHETNVALLASAARALLPISLLRFVTDSWPGSSGFVGLQGWQVQATLYWIRTLYGLVAFPFVVFKLPLMGGLLTRSKATGYDRRGRTVLSKVDKHPLAKKRKVTLPEDEDDEEEYNIWVPHAYVPV